MAKAKARSTLPLDDPRWWVLDRAHQYRRRQIGDDVLATQDIRLAVEYDRLPAKIELYNQRIGARVSQLLPGWFFRCQFQITLFIGPNNSRLGAYPHTLMRRGGWDYKNLISPTFFVWGPKVEELWPERVEELWPERVPLLSEVAISPPSPPPLHGTKRWIYELMQHHPAATARWIWEQRPDEAENISLSRVQNVVGELRRNEHTQKRPRH
jgi:hypothetical protein